jgi:AraC-like DNA-binding protein
VVEPNGSRPAPTTTEYGVLGGERQDFTLTRYPPAPDLAGYLERHWVTRWSLPPGEESPVTLLPHPCVNLVLDTGRLVVSGVGTERFTRVLTGDGEAYGVKFRPGAFQPFLGRPVSELTGRIVPLATVWGAPAAELEAVLNAVRGVDERIRITEEFLRRRRPAPDPNVELVGEVVRALLGDRTITRVDDVTRRFGISARSLQRLFKRYVGVAPKWVLQRYRLHEAAARLAEGTSGTWAEVAVELGYFDQPHFIRDFHRAVGMTPLEYLAACERREAPVPA